MVYVVATLLWLLIVGAMLATVVWLVRSFNPCFCW
jgi:hypothetical protein